MVSGSGMSKKVVVIDARHHMLGRLSSIVAKELLNGQKIVRLSIIFHLSSGTGSVGSEWLSQTCRIFVVFALPTISTNAPKPQPQPFPQPTDTYIYQINAMIFHSTIAATYLGSQL